MKLISVFLKHHVVACGCVLAMVLVLPCQSILAATVFSADFESAANDTSAADQTDDSNFSADVGTLSTTGTRTRVKTPNNASAVLDWESKALRIDRDTGDPAHRIDWAFTSPIELAGATVEFEFLIRRGGGAASNSTEDSNHFFTGYDSNDNKVFELILISRADGYANFADYLGLNETLADDRQDKTVGYVDSINGNSLFAASQIASGSLPDTKNTDSGSTITTGLFGGNDTPAPREAAAFSISLTSTGWSLSATPAPLPDVGAGGQLSSGDPPLGAFTTTEIPFFNAGVVDLARVEINGFTNGAGAYWDNLAVNGTVIPEPAGLSLLAMSLLVVCGRGNRRQR